MPSAANRLLVLDDEVAICRWIARVAADRGFEVTTTQDADELARLYDAVQPTLVLLDLVLGSRDGIQVLRGLAASGRRAPIVLMSGLDGRVLSCASRLGQALDLDISAAVLKPLALEDLRTLLDAHRHDEASTPSVDRGPIAPAAGPHAPTLHGVLDTAALVVHYQPQRDMRDGALAGAEALVRWQHPDLGLVSPGSFLARAERSGFMRALTMAVLRESVAQCRRWADRGHHVPIAVNLSPVLLEDLALPDEIERVTLEAGLVPGLVTLELTESAAIARWEAAMDVLTRLRLKGFRLALDDFGVGFSSLLELQHMPFTEVKIDRSFVAEAASDPTAHAIVDAVVGLGRRLSLRIVAEGIETPDAWSLVRGAGCDVGQGFLVSRPLPPAAFDAFLAETPRKARLQRRAAAS
jgi:EAL domain-containing protein (putative c-di-GMP-specific phosphodiesterase class I)